MLLGINEDVESNEPETDEYIFKWYHCGDPGHSQYKFPQLSQKERQDLYKKFEAEKLLEKKSSDDQAEKTGTKKNKTDKAVLFHLGNDIPEETEPDNS